MIKIDNFSFFGIKPTYTLRQRTWGLFWGEDVKRVSVGFKCCTINSFLYIHFIIPDWWEDTLFPCIIQNKKNSTFFSFSQLLFLALHMKAVRKTVIPVILQPLAWTILKWYELKFVVQVCRTLIQESSTWTFIYRMKSF